MERNILLKIEYDGSGFSGWQRQPGKRTVQGVLEEALSKFCACEIRINGTSRTDAGVHALCQCASFKADFRIPLDKLKLAVNNYLVGGMSSLNPVGDVKIVSCEEVPDTFHARFDCKGKTYRYVIRNSRDFDVFRRNYCYFVKDELNLDAMREATGHIVGTHDFASFQSAGGNERETTVRTVSNISIFSGKDNTNIGENMHRICADDDIVIEITGDGFLYNMVRIIVGTLVEVGLGKREPGNLAEIIQACDRTGAGHTAPAAGLYLKEIYF